MLLLLLAFFFLLCVLKVNVGHDFNVALREHDTGLCERDSVSRRLEHLTNILGLKKQCYRMPAILLFLSAFSSNLISLQTVFYRLQDTLAQDFLLRGAKSG